MGGRVGTAAVLGIVAALSVGCSATEQLHTPPLLLVRDATPPGLPPPRDVLGYTRSPNGAPVRDAAAPDAASLAGLFLSDYAEAAAIRGDPVLARKMLKSGMTVIEARCHLFFESIGRGSQRVDLASRQIATLTTALVAVLGLAGAGETAVAAVGVGSGLGLQALRNYSDVFFFSPDVALVHELVRKAFAGMRTIAESPDSGAPDFDTAIGFLLRHQNICTAHEIKALVDGAMRSSKVEASISGGNSAVSPAVTASLTSLARQLSVPTLPLDQIGLLARLADPNMPAAEGPVICQLLEETLSRRLCARDNGRFTGRKAEPATFDQINVMLAYLRQTDPDLIDERIASASSRIDPFVQQITALNAKVAELTPKVAAGQAPAAELKAVVAERSGVIGDTREQLTTPASVAAPVQPASIEIKVVGSD